MLVTVFYLLLPDSHWLPSLSPQSIEMRLKVSLHEDLGAALMDGVVLCHLVNHIRPRSVASIHVPSPAVVSHTISREMNFYLKQTLSEPKHLEE